MSLVSSDCGPGRVRKMPAPTYARVSTAGLCFASSRRSVKRPPTWSPMVMAEDHVGHVAQVDLQLACVFENSLGPRSGVEQDAVPGRLDDRRESPLPHAGPVGEHRREDHHFEVS